MKLSATLLVVLPLLASEILAVAIPDPIPGSSSSALLPRAKGKGKKGKKGSAAKGLKGAAAAGGAAGAAAGAGSVAVADAAANKGGKGGAAAAAANDLQSSLTLDPSVIAKGFENDGQGTPEAGQVASLTSSNNFINFCAVNPQIPLTNGQQVKSGSCNPAPMGLIPATQFMPSSKFVFPPNMGVVPANKEFTIQMAISNLETGNFVNAQQNYFSAPQQLNSKGQIVGHSHVVVEKLDSLAQTTPTNPNVFAFFKGLNAPADGKGILTADVTSGLPAGVYRLASINTAANHQPALVPIAQHGSLDDAVYFTVSDSGAGAAGAEAGAAGAAGAAAAAAAAGKKGAQGAAAAGGKKGFGGKKGEAGAQGAGAQDAAAAGAAAEGAAGAAGAEGAAGKKGFGGKKGEAGAGAQGAAAEQGAAEQGAAGKKGVGAAGAEGAVNAAAGEGAAGEKAFGGKKGGAGAEGAEGAQGADEQGVAGKKGFGEQGAAGKKGFGGAGAAAGEQGAAAAAGAGGAQDVAQFGNENGGRRAKQFGRRAGQDY